jgi:hypothetical protein
MTDRCHNLPAIGTCVWHRGVLDSWFESGSGRVGCCGWWDADHRDGWNADCPGPCGVDCPGMVERGLPGVMGRRLPGVMGRRLPGGGATRIAQGGAALTLGCVMEPRMGFGFWLHRGTPPNLTPRPSPLAPHPSRSGCGKTMLPSYWVHSSKLVLTLALYPP